MMDYEHNMIMVMGPMMRRMMTPGDDGADPAHAVIASSD